MPYIYKSGKKYGGAGGAEGSSSEYRKLLWTNPSPTATFAPQTVNVDLSDYDDVEIIFRHDWQTDWHMDSRTSVGKVGAITNARPDSFLSQERQFTTTNTGITFTDCKLGTSAQVFNNHSIPIYIYGIKYERVAPPQIDAVQEIEVAINGMGVSSGSLTAYKMGHLVLVTGMIRPSLTGTGLTLATVTGCPAVADTWAICGGYDNATQEMYMNANSADLLFNTTGMSDLKINFCYITTA